MGYRGLVARPTAVVVTTLLLAGCAEINPAFYEDDDASTSSTPGSTSGTTAIPATSSSSSGGTSSSSGGSGVPAAFCETVDDAVVFCTDFEEGDLDIWDDIDGNIDVENVLTSDPGPRGADDNHVMRLRIPPGAATVDLVKLLPGFYDRLYMRWYIQYENGYDMSRPGLGSGLHAGDRSLLGVSDVQPAGDDRFAVLTSHTPEDPQMLARLDYRGMYQACADPQSACYRDSLPCTGDASVCTNSAHTMFNEAPPLQTGQWYCVELMVDAGTPVSSADLADGTVSLSLDGQTLGLWDDLWLRTSEQLKLNVAWIVLYFGGDHGDEGVLYDDLVISREPVGCW